MRPLPLVVVLVAAWAAAGCATVSPAPRPSGPSLSSHPAAVAAGAAHPDGATGARSGPPSAPPVHQAIGTTGPDVASTPHPAPAEVRPAPATRVGAAAPDPERRRGRSGRRRPAFRPGTNRSGTVPPAPLVGRAPDVCRLGRTYGGWSGGSPAARICRGAYGG
ncbi:hypothetical protein V2S66_31160 [Streptomyces sp. V4-01]|uniref:Lipoprotein n=1 Tax=Actinacidiphila polyblastidii TaxID=3110430 RepID=A0ABU7PKP1_9ACTN|nr:hypothetical protein [Streptomyces sp. V4-01]